MLAKNLCRMCLHHFFKGFLLFLFYLNSLDTASFPVVVLITSIFSTSDTPSSSTQGKRSCPFQQKTIPVIDTSAVSGSNPGSVFTVVRFTVLKHTSNSLTSPLGSTSLVLSPIFISVPFLSLNPVFISFSFLRALSRPFQ